MMIYFTTFTIHASASQPASDTSESTRVTCGDCVLSFAAACRARLADSHWLAPIAAAADFSLNSPDSLSLSVVL